MKYMIASDIHGSAMYCEQMIEAYKREGAERLVILGDILYHGPRNDLPEGYAPKEVIAMLNPLKENFLCVRGNCDTEVDQMVLEFPVMADYCFIELPGAAPETAEGETEEKTGRDEQGSACGMVSIFATHGHIWHPKHLPPMRNGDILLTGHTHIPACEEIKDGMGNKYRYLNPGSVSIPKEGSVHSYMIYEEGIFRWKNMQGEEYMIWKTDSRS